MRPSPQPQRHGYHLPPLLADPAAAAERLSGLLERCWQVLLAPWWERIRDLLDADIAFRPRRLADGGLERLFADLDVWPGWCWCPTRPGSRP